jgi:hypothetical protein
MWGEGLTTLHLKNSPHVSHVGSFGCDDSPHVPTCVAQANRRGVNTREGAKSGAARLERMKRGRGIEGRDDKSSGIEIRMADAFAKINPTDPLILA